MFEQHHQPLLPRDQFVARLFKNGMIAIVILAVAMGIGIVGFLLTGTHRVVDAFLLGGMGPVGDLQRESDSAKIFASLYALFAGVVFLVSVGVLLAPVIHRLMHRFHLADDK
jgi:predicted Kef-type K+ transport protein